MKQLPDITIRDIRIQLIAILGTVLIAAGVATFIMCVFRDIPSENIRVVWSIITVLLGSYVYMAQNEFEKDLFS